MKKFVLLVIAIFALALIGCDVNFNFNVNTNAADAKAAKQTEVLKAKYATENGQKMLCVEYEKDSGVYTCHKPKAHSEYFAKYGL